MTSDFIRICKKNVNPIMKHKRHYLVELTLNCSKFLNRFCIRNLCKSMPFASCRPNPFSLTQFEVDFAQNCTPLKVIL